MRREKLNIDIPKDILTIHELFKKTGHQLFVVGGSVRDALLSKIPKDFDLATDAEPDKVQFILGGFRMLETGKSFGVINVFTDSGEFEIATFREDSKEGDGRRPDSVRFTTIENDVKRRDLTINALFYDLETREVVDLVGGIDDLRNGVIRTVGDPQERFDEDRLRVLRAIRFAARFGSDLSPETSEAILKDNSLAKVSKERIRDEFLKGISSAKSVVFFMELLKKYDLFEQIFPGIAICDDFIETKNLHILFCQLFRDSIGSEKAITKTLEDGTFTGDEISKTMFLLHFMDKNLDISKILGIKKTEMVLNDPKRLEKKPLAGVTEDDFKELMVISPVKRILQAFIRFKLTIGGKQLQLEGFTGPEISKETLRRETENFQAILEKI